MFWDFQTITSVKKKKKKVICVYLFGMFQPWGFQFQITRISYKNVLFCLEFLQVHCLKVLQSTFRLNAEQ